MIPTQSRALLRAGAFHALLARVWGETEPGVGTVRPGSADVVPHLYAWLADREAPDRHRAAFLLGLLADATAGPELPAVHRRIADGVGTALDALDDHGRRPAETGAALRGALLYLLAQHPDRDTEILARVTAALGGDAPGTGALQMVFGLARTRPERSRFVRLYLGAEACADAGHDQLALAESVLACPSCLGRLAFADAAISCVACAAEYGWASDSPDLVPAGSTDVDEYPAEVVDLYETASRPRFVQVMANDWHGQISPDREAAYIGTHLRPVDGPVLDLACGAGGWTRRLADHVGRDRVIAIDISPAMLSACRAAVPGVLTVRGSAGALPVATAALGGANCSDALQALPDPEAALAQVARCLRPGAPFTAFTFLAAASPYRHFQQRFPVHPRRLFTPDRLREAVERAGLSLVDFGGPQQAVFLTAHRPPAGGQVD